MIVDELSKIINSIDPSSTEDDMLNSNEENYVMPEDAACSAEFSVGCILMGEEE